VLVQLVIAPVFRDLGLRPPLSRPNHWRICTSANAHFLPTPWAWPLTSPRPFSGWGAFQIAGSNPVALDHVFS
jgi:hypothetical protein